jgi:hypothetical protein
MKIDDLNDALSAAHHLANATVEQIADALLEAHLEGIEQGRSPLLQGKSVDQALDELDERRRFLRAQIKNK